MREKETYVKEFKLGDYVQGEDGDGIRYGYLHGFEVDEEDEDLWMLKDSAGLEWHYYPGELTLAALPVPTSTEESQFQRGDTVTVSGEGTEEWEVVGYRPNETYPWVLLNKDGGLRTVDTRHLIFIAREIRPDTPAEPKFQVGDIVTYNFVSGDKEWEIVGHDPDATYPWKLHRGGRDRIAVKAKEIAVVARKATVDDAPNHYTYLQELLGLEPWDILDCVAGDDPLMWNLGKYWFRLGRKDGESTLKDKKKMLTYLQRSIEQEESV